MLGLNRLEGFECTGCGDCCRWTGSVLLVDHDIAALSEELGLSEQVFIERHTRLAPNRIQLALLDQPDGSCEFLKDNHCTVYASRPEQCRSFPFAWSVPEGCPALDELVARQKNIEQPQQNA